MTLHLSPPAPALADRLAVWRARHPKFASALDRGDPPAKALRFLGLALWQEDDPEEAVTALAAANSLAPDDAAILSDLAGALSVVGRKAEALEAFIASLERDPSCPQVWLGAAALSNEVGDKTSAEHAFLAALELDPHSAEACAGLGLLYLERARFEEAAQLLGDAVARGVEDGATFACLGQSLFLLGRFAEGRAALEKAARVFPDEAAIVRKCASATLIVRLIESPVAEAIEAYRTAAGAYAEDTPTACRAAFQALCGYGHAEAALRLGEAIVAMEPNDPVIPFHLEALRGVPRERASPDYVAACFDRYADDFDRHLVEVLGYRLPEKLPALLAAAGRRFPRILDLGCGTGLSADALAAAGDDLTGVDLSTRMLAKARARNLYTRLIEADAIAFFDAEPRRFDLIVALDMVIYFGDLSALFAGVARSLPRDGLFVFSFETGSGHDYKLAPCGRYAHDPAYVEMLWRSGFECLLDQQVMLRLEANRPVDGRFVLLRRK